MPFMTHKTILCVDDSPTVLLSMTTALAEVGYTVITAADGEEALLKALETSPDLVLLDVVLPKRNGFQVCRLLKSSPATKMPRCGGPQATPSTTSFFDWANNAMQCRWERWSNSISRRRARSCRTPRLSCMA